MLVILTPQAMTDPTKTAEELKPYAQSLGKPVLASWMGGADVEKGELVLSQANIPTFPYPDTAARMFDYMAQYSDNLRAPVRDALAARRQRRLRSIVAGRRDHRAGAAGGAHDPDRVRIQAAAGVLTASRRWRPASRKAKMQLRSRRLRSVTRWCSSCTLRRSRTRPMWAACSSTWAMTKAVRKAFRAHSRIQWRRKPMRRSISWA